MNLRQISTVSSPVFLPCQVKIFNIFNWSSVLYIQFAVRVTCNMWLLKNYEISFFSHRNRALWSTRMLTCSFLEGWHYYYFYYMRYDLITPKYCNNLNICCRVNYVLAFEAPRKAKKKFNFDLNITFIFTMLCSTSYFIKIIIKQYFKL